ncbi:hypothetical protein [Streptomyces sp. NPDC058953]|uniref:hypothetical protein n=1 Tax=unclassified Streptomyces TaxID=2593676 RepID=UPI0036BD0635
MDAVRVALLREVLAGTEWPGAARRFAGALRGSVSPRGDGLLLVGTEEYEPWHLAAHLVDEAAWSGRPELDPTLIRHRARPGDPPHLAVGPARLRRARRGETLLLVAPDRPGDGLLTHLEAARRAGATLFTLDGGDRDVLALAHESLTVAPDTDGIDLDTVQHLVSAAAGEHAGPLPTRGRRTLGDRVARLVDHLTSPPPERW